MTSFSFKRTWPFLVFAFIFALGLTLRLLPLQARDAWFDEAFTGIVVRQSLPKMMDIIVRDVHPPLYYVVLKGWTLPFGSTLLSLRAFSVFFGMSMITTAFFALRSWDKKRWWPALAGSFVLAINPFFVNYGQEARMYALLGFLLLLCAWVFLAHQQHASRAQRLIYSVLILAILLTHYVGAIFALVFFLADLCTHRDLLKKRGQALASWFASGYLIPFLGGCAWLPFFFKQITHHGSLGWVPNASLSRLPETLHIFLFGAPVGVAGVPPALGYVMPWLSVAGVSAILLILIIGLAAWLTVRRKWDAPTRLAAFLAFFPLFLTLALQQVHLQLYVERFLTGSGLFLVLWMILGLAKVPVKSLAAASLIGYAALVILVKPWQYTSTFPILTEQIRSFPVSQPIIFTDPGNFTLERFYLGEDDLSRIHLYQGPRPEDRLWGWAIIDQHQQIYSLPAEPHGLVTTNPANFPTYHEIISIQDIHLMQSL